VSHPRGGRSHLWGWLAGHPATCRHPFSFRFLVFFLKKYINFNIFY
jgi:prepilin signal peptidase PulO-like enzyme (type II secretory pathway)